MTNLKKILIIGIPLLLLTSCQLISIFIIENDSPNAIVITYSNWPKRYVAEPRVGYLDNVKKTEYKLELLPLADFKYGNNKCEIIVTVPPKSAICLAGMQDINVYYADKYFAGAKLFIKTANGSINYEGSEIIKLFIRDSRYNLNYTYTYK